MDCMTNIHLKPLVVSLTFELFTVVFQLAFSVFLSRAEPEATVSAKKPKIDVSSYCLEQGERQLVN